MGRESMSQGSRISGTGSYGNATIPRENVDDVPELTAAQVRQAYEAALAEDQSAQATIETQRNGDAFLAGHPEFVDNVPNAKLIVNQMDTMYGKGVHTLAHFEGAFQYLRENTNFLKLDKTVLAAQEKQAAKERFNAERERMSTTVFNESVAATLPLDELRRRAEQTHADNFRKIAEEGGY